MENKDIIKQYMQEIESLEAFTEEQNKSILINAKSGSEDAKSKLVEGNLYIVPLRVSEFLDSQVNVNDMIQEGNMALIEAVDSLINGEEDDVDNFAQYFSEIIDISLNAFVTEESQAAMAAKNMASMANRLLDVTTKFEKENERPATLSELAKLMGMEEDDVENILKTSYNAMKLAEENSTEK